MQRLPLNKLKVLVQIDEAINKVDRLFKVASQVPSNSLYLDDLATKYFKVIQNNPNMIMRCDEQTAKEVYKDIAVEHGDVNLVDLLASYEACPHQLIEEASEHVASVLLMEAAMKVTMNSFGYDEFPGVLVARLMDVFPVHAEERKRMVTEIIKQLLSALNS